MPTITNSLIQGYQAGESEREYRRKLDDAKMARRLEQRRLELEQKEYEATVLNNERNYQLGLAQEGRLQDEARYNNESTRLANKSARLENTKNDLLVQQLVKTTTLTQTEGAIERYTRTGNVNVLNKAANASPFIQNMLAEQEISRFENINPKYDRDFLTQFDIPDEWIDNWDAYKLGGYFYKIIGTDGGELLGSIDDLAAEVGARKNFQDDLLKEITTKVANISAAIGGKDLEINRKEAEINRIKAETEKFKADTDRFKEENAAETNKINAETNRLNAELAKSKNEKEGEVLSDEAIEMEAIKDKNTESYKKKLANFKEKLLKSKLINSTQLKDFTNNLNLTAGLTRATHQLVTISKTKDEKMLVNAKNAEAISGFYDKFLNEFKNYTSNPAIGDDDKLNQIAAKYNLDSMNISRLTRDLGSVISKIEVGLGDIKINLNKQDRNNLVKVREMLIETKAHLLNSLALVPEPIKRVVANDRIEALDLSANALNYALGFVVDEQTNNVAQNNLREQFKNDPRIMNFLDSRGIDIDTVDLDTLDFLQ